MLRSIPQLVHRGRIAMVAIVGIALLAFGVANLWSTARLVADGDHVTGRVVDSLRSTSDGETEHRAVVAYRVDGVERRITLGKQEDRAPRRGRPQELLVHPDDPEDARADHFAELWLGTIVLFTFGVLALLAVAYSLWWRGRRRH